MCPSLIQIGSKTAEKNSAQTNRQTDTTKIMVTWSWTNKAALLLQTDGSIVFAAWHQCALTWGHIGEYDWTSASFGPPKSTTQTVNQSVQPFLHSAWQSLVGHALIIAPSHEGSGPPLIHAFLPSQLVQPFVHSSWHSVAILYYASSHRGYGFWTPI